MEKVLLIGCGYMGLEYAKVLAAQRIPFEVVGRGKKKIKSFLEKFPAVQAFSGGIQKYLTTRTPPPYAVVAVNVVHLFEITCQLINVGVKNILVEKPVALKSSQIQKLMELAKINSVRVLVAYNRRFYKSAELAKEIVKADKGILSAHFEFTEWVHAIDDKKYSKQALQKWVLGNSSHVIDLFFYFCGVPTTLNSMTKGKNILWHPSGSLFIGSGITTKNILFTYHSNWNAPGRWSMEIMTAKHRLFFKPMERLMIQVKGSVQIKEIESDYSLDMNYKPGLFNQVKAFLNHTADEKICLLEEHATYFPFYEKIGGYH